MTVSENKCGDCEFFNANFCHRYPPTVVWIGHEAVTVYPKVTEEHVSCGEWVKSK